MNFGLILLVAAAVFGLCFLVDKGFTKYFRGKAQHASGLSVRMNKRYGTFGVILLVLGIAALFAGLKGTMILLFGGPIVALMGVGLIVYYLFFGIYYDNECFVYSTFGKKSVTYRYTQIRGQMLYLVNGGNIIELHMSDGKAVSLQISMIGVYPFLDKALENWCRQKNISPEACDFHDPDKSCWFPNV